MGFSFHNTSKLIISVQEYGSLSNMNTVTSNINVIYVCLSVFLVCMYAFHMHSVPTEARTSQKHLCPRTGITDGCEQTHKPLWKRRVLLTAVPSLQSHKFIFYFSKIVYKQVSIFYYKPKHPTIMTNWHNKTVTR